MLEGYKVIGDVFEFITLQGEMTEEQSEVATLMKLLGASPDTPLRLIGMMSEDDFQAVINSAAWVMNALPPTPTTRSKAALLGRIARIACGQQLTYAAHQEQENKKRLHEVEILKLKAEAAAAAPAGLLALTPPPPLTPEKLTKKVKMSMVADQVFDQEIECLSDEKITECYANYTKIFGDVPSSEEEVTIEQLSALHTLIASGSPPYVDFAVWGPHGYRLMRKLRLTGLMLTAGGDLRNVELAGPPTFGMWERCYACLKTGLLMLGAVSISNLLKYHDLMKKYHERYGPSVWHLQYQSEVRQRQERMIHHRRAGQEEARLAASTSSTSRFSADKPWDYAWARAVEDFHWWRSELEEPCLLILTRTRSLAAMVDGDVEINAEPEAKRRKGGGSGAQDVQKSGWESGYGSQELSLKNSKFHERQHNVSNGAHVTNRRGVVLCNDFNLGTCTETIGQNRCKKEPNKIHQCSKCFSLDHPATQCTKALTGPPAQPAWIANRKGSGGKGGGKSKGKFGKGKKGGRYYG